MSSVDAVICCLLALIVLLCLISVAAIAVTVCARV